MPRLTLLGSSPTHEAIIQEVGDGSVETFTYAEGRRLTNTSVLYADQTNQNPNNPNRVTRTASTLLKQYDDINAVDDEARFDKQGPENEVTVRVGESADVPFKFVVAAGVGDVSDSVLVDHVDHEVFNVTAANLADIKATLTGHVDWWPTLSGDDFNLVLNGDGDLEITLSQSGVDKVVAGGKSLEARYEVNLTLPTHVFTQRSTLDINNSATYSGDSTDLTFVDTVTSQATTYGNQLELQKQVYNAATDRFTPNLRVEVDSSNELTEDEFVYRVRIMPHGTFQNMVRAIVDVLPTNVDFVGFVNDPADTTVLPGNSYQFPGSSLRAEYDATANTVTVPTGRLNQGQNLELMFRVKVNDFTEDVGIRNVVGPASATIVPTNGYPLDISKIDADDVDEEVSITDRDARFEVRAEGSDQVLFDDVYVVGGKLVRPGDEEGTDKSLIVPEPGTYEIRELIAPDGYVPTSEVFLATVDGQGATRTVTISNSPKYYAVGDIVWIDANDNGLQDDEDILPGVGVELLDGDNNVVASTTTDADGRYLFDGLRAGDYQVRFTLTPGQAYQYKFTSTGTGSDDGVDSDAVVQTNPAVGLTEVFTLNDETPGLTDEYTDQVFTAPQGIDPTWDAGVVLKTYAVGDYTWIDSNRNGIQDEGEDILDDVLVELLAADGETVVATTTTDEFGQYLFDEVPAGRYQIRFTLSEDDAEVYVFTTANAGSDDAVDSDAARGTGLTAFFNLDDTNTALDLGYEDQTFTATEGVDPTWDAGVVTKSYAVGDYVWIDADRDGVQDDDELPLEGVTVTLLNPDGTPVDGVAPVPTDEFGRYLFDDVPAGDYKVRFTLTPEQSELYTFTGSDLGGDDAADSDANRATGETAVFTLDDDNTALVTTYDRDFVATQGVDPTWDAGVVTKTYAVGDYVWIDADRDGVQDEGELPLEDVKVELLAADGETVIATTTTDEFGRYKFDNLPAGDYRVKFTLTEDQAKLYNFTSRDSGTNDAVDSDVFESTGLTVQFTLDDTNRALTKNYEGVTATEGIDPTWDAGVILKTYAVGDYVWIDADNDGIQDEGELPLEDVKVELLAADGETVVATTETDEFGRYLFDELDAGTYSVRFTLTEDQSKLYNFTTPTAGTDTAVDSNAHLVTGTSAPFVLDTTNESLTKVYDKDVLATEGVDPTWDAGVVRKTYAIGDIVWIDADRDGIQDDSEILEDVTVELIDPVTGDVLQSTETDEFGRYLFDNLFSGEYQVRFTLTDAQALIYTFTTPNAGTDDSVDSDADGNGLTVRFTLDDETPGLTDDYTDQVYEASEGIDPTWDAGVVLRTYAVGDYVWIDSDNDGVQDEGELPLEDVKVELLAADGETVVATTTTDEFGRYLFDELDAGTYSVRFTLTEDQSKLYNFTLPTQGADGAVDSNADLVTGTSAPFVLDTTNASLTKVYDKDVLATEGVDPTWDAGVVRKTYAIGDYVWIDEDGDGIQDEDELPLEDVTVELIDPETGEVLKTTETDEFGKYLFDEIPSGEYQIRFTLTPEQEKLYNFTSKEQGEEAGEDSNPDEFGLTPPFTLNDDSPGLTREYDDQEWNASEGVDPTWDAGVVRKTYAIGDYVWVDLDRDGVQDEGEPVLAGTLVELLDAEGNVLASMPTDDEGRYLFDNLRSGEYQVRFTLTEDQAKLYNFTGQDAGSDDAADSDADPAGLTVLISLNDDTVGLTDDYDREYVASEGVDPTWDAGVVRKTYAVGDIVWIDSDRDGIQDEGEPVLPGVTVELLDSEGNVVKTTTTDENGRYLIDEIESGEYQIRFTLTPEQQKKYNFTSPNTGGAGEDSDSDPTGLTPKFVLDDDTPGLTREYGDQEWNASEGVDPTWDAGVVEKTYAVGDIVWVDANNNGIQDDSEILEGVKVELLDATGKVIATTTTDANGRYIFDDLVGGDYQIRFTLTEEQAAKYMFTNRNAGANGVDSDADPSGLTIKFTLDGTNTSLTKDYTDQEFSASEGIDPTWDAGVVLIPAKPKPGLPPSGVDTGESFGALAGALVAAAAGAAFLARRRTA